MSIKRNLAMSVFVLMAGLLAMPSCLYATDSDPIEKHALDKEHPTTVHQFIYHIKRDPAPVGILINDVTFSIPRYYLSSLYTLRPYLPVMFSILTFYPDFAGATTEDDGAAVFPQSKEWRYRKWKWLDSPNLIEIEGLAEYLPPGKTRNGIVFEAEKNEPDHPWEYGLLKSTKSLSSRVQDVYFERPGKGDSGYVAFCGTNELQECDVYMPISTKVYIQYKFHRDLLPHWQEIHQKVSRLIQSFIVKKEK